LIIHFLILEALHYLLALYFAFRYKGASIIYLPVLFFYRYLYESQVPAMFWYLIIALFVAFVISQNLKFYRRSHLSLVFLAYMMVLVLINSSPLLNTSYFFNFSLLLLIIPLILHVTRKHDSIAIQSHLHRVSLWIMALFVINVGISSATGYVGPEGADMYGFTAGLVYGGMFAVHFNILPLAIFYASVRNFNKPNLFEYALMAVSTLLLLFSLRRSVMVIMLLLLALLIILFQFEKKRIKTYVVLVLPTVLVLIMMIYYDVGGMFYERYAHRGLGEQVTVTIEDETRFAEYPVIYRDLFVYRAYNPLIGFEVFNSPGNYGRGMFGERTLHSDPTTIVHSSGLIGLMLYLVIFLTIFYRSFNRALDSRDRLIILAFAGIFIIYAITGRITETAYISFFIMILSLPYNKKHIFNE